MLVIVGASGKLGFATLNAILDDNLISAENIVCTTSSESGANKLEAARRRGVQIRSANWDDPASTWTSALSGCTKLFLISSSRISKDFGDAAPGQGREADHFKVLQVAQDIGVEHVYYTSLAFARPSKSRVMTAHERTEDWLAQSGMRYTIVREGLYNESWPLYLGYYKVPDDERPEVTLGGDGKISWTSIPDLGLANALILAAPSDEWAGKVFYLSQKQAYSMREVTDMVSKARGKELTLKVTTRDEHEQHYIQERGMGGGAVKWWSRTYDALNDDECEIDDSTLEDLLASRSRKPKALQDTIEEMLGGS